MQEYSLYRLCAKWIGSLGQKVKPSKIIHCRSSEVEMITEGGGQDTIRPFMAGWIEATIQLIHGLGVDDAKIHCKFIHELG